MIIIDILFYLFVMVMFILPIYLIVKKVKKRNSANGNEISKEIIKIEKEKTYDKLDMTHIAGIDNIQKTQDCKIILYSDKINIFFNKNMEFNIKSENIKGMSIILAKDLLEKKKSPVLRGVVGNMIAGSGGLILGGMSGLNKGKKSEWVLIINYVSKNSEEKSLVFGIKYNKLLAENFIKKFEKLNGQSMKINTEL
ncbi:MAG: hypothetical protein ACM3O4_04505 [Ignavibacteriales bacterium]